MGCFEDCANAFFGGLCYNFFGTKGWNLSPHCRVGNQHQGDKTRSKNPRSSCRNTRTEVRSVLFFGGDFFGYGEGCVFLFR